MYTAINYSKYHFDHEIENLAERMTGKVSDVDDDDEKEFTLAEFSLYHCDINSCFELGYDASVILRDTATDIECLLPYIEDGPAVSNFIYLEKMHVQPQYRRQGITRRVFQHIGKLWSELPLILVAKPMHDMKDKYTSEDLQKWYETLGFRKIPGIESEYVLMKKEPVDQYMIG